MLAVGFLILVLLMPLGFVKDLIRERGFRQTEVIEEINTKWGKEVILNGPILKVPYLTYVEEKVFDDKTKTFIVSQKPEKHLAYFFPWELNIKSDVKTQPLERGIYESVVYTSENAISGKFAQIDFSGKDVSNKDVLWEKATLLFKTSNLKGIRNTVKIALGDHSYALKPKFDNTYLNTLESGYLKDLENI
ncbi:MAG: inner membrane CreD family protein, partial [Bacteroidota bacterium]